jgi:pre-rRNA-processing protein TSR1
MMPAAPLLVAVIDLCTNDNSGASLVYNSLVQSSLDGNSPLSQTPLATTLTAQKLKRSVTFAMSPRDVVSVLELGKVADTLLFVLTAGMELDAFGEIAMTALCAQGLPTVSHVIVGLDDVPVKRRPEVKKASTKTATTVVPFTKVHSIEKPSDFDTLAWNLVNQRTRVVRFRAARPHLLAEAVEYVESTDAPGTGSLKLTGYVRGRHLNVNSLVYLSGFGAFQIAAIEKHGRTTHTKRGGSDAISSGTTTLTPDPTLQETLQSEMPIDPLAAEQTWPTEDELREADADARARRNMTRNTTTDVRVLAPKGTSSYQAAWIPEDDADHMDDGGEDDDEDDEDDDDEEGSEDGSAHMGMCAVFNCF